MQKSVCVYVYIYMCVYIYVCIYIHIYMIKYIYLIYDADEMQKSVCVYVYMCVCVYIYTSIYIYIYMIKYIYLIYEMQMRCRSLYGVTLVSRVDTIIGLFCKIALLKRQYSAKETYSLIDPTNRSHPIYIYVYI